MTRIRVISLILITAISSLFTPSANAGATFTAPTLEKVFINSDATVAVLYWSPGHGTPEQPIVDYAYTIDGINYIAIGTSYQSKYETTISLGTRANASPFIFAIASVLKSGLGPVSNVMKGSYNPYVVPVKLSEVTPRLEGFSFRVLDVDYPGWTFDRVGIYVTDLEGPSNAYIDTKSGGVGNIQISGLSQGQSATVTIYKKVNYCYGYSVTYTCPYSTSVQVTGTSLRAIPDPIFGSVTQRYDGFTSSIKNYDPNLSYSFDAPGGITAIVDGEGLIFVRGLTPGQGAKLTLQVSHTGYQAVTAVVIGSSLSKAYLPELSANISTANGFYVTVNNYDASYKHEVVVKQGFVSISSSGVITVTGLGPGTSTSILLNVYKDDVLITTIPITGTAKVATKKPVVKKKG